MSNLNCLNNLMIRKNLIIFFIIVNNIYKNFFYNTIFFFFSPKTTNFLKWEMYHLVKLKKIIIQKVLIT